MQKKSQLPCWPDRPMRRSWLTRILCQCVSTKPHAPACGRPRHRLNHQPPGLTGPAYTDRRRHNRLQQRPRHSGTRPERTGTSSRLLPWRPLPDRLPRRRRRPRRHTSRRRHRYALPRRRRRSPYSSPACLPADNYRTCQRPPPPGSRLRACRRSRRSGPYLQSNRRSRLSPKAGSWTDSSSCLISTEVRYVVNPSAVPITATGSLFHHTVLIGNTPGSCEYTFLQADSGRRSETGDGRFGLWASKLPSRPHPAQNPFDDT